MNLGDIVVLPHHIQSLACSDKWNDEIIVTRSRAGLSRATKTDQTLMQTMAGTLDYCGMCPRVLCVRTCD